MIHSVLQMGDSVLFYEMSYGDNFCDLIISELKVRGVISSKIMAAHETTRYHNPSRNWNSATSDYECDTI